MFFKGALLNDAKGILIQQTKNVQAVRQIRFTNIRQIVEMKRILKAYIHEAIEVEKAGLKVPALKTAFKALTPGRSLFFLPLRFNRDQYRKYEKHEQQ